MSDKSYKVIFDEIILRQLKKAGKNRQLRSFLSKIFNKIENLGPDAGKIIDPKFFLYEVEMKSPPLRLYYRIDFQRREAYVFEYEMKTSPAKQKGALRRIKDKLLKS